MKKIIVLALSILCMSSHLLIPVYAAPVSDVRIAAQPIKLSYTAGELFDPTGMVITVTYTDGTSAPAEAADYTYSPAGPLSTVHTAIIIDCAGKKLTLPITVTAATGTVAATEQGGADTTTPDALETDAEPQSTTAQKNKPEKKPLTNKANAEKAPRTDRQGQNWGFFQWFFAVLLIAAVACILIAYYRRHFSGRR